MQRTAYVMVAAFLIAITSAFTIRANDVWVRESDPVFPCQIVNCSQAPLRTICSINAPVDGKYYKPGCVEPVIAYRITISQ